MKTDDDDDDDDDVEWRDIDSVIQNADNIMRNI